MTDDEQVIRVEESVKKFFTMIPNLYDDLGLTPYEFRLLVHYLRIGNCTEGLATTSRKCCMSSSKTSECRSSLEVSGVINLRRIMTPNGMGYSVTVLDRWSENMRKYSKPSHSEGKPSHSEGKPSHSEGKPSHSEGKPSHSEGKPSHSEGINNQPRTIKNLNNQPPPPESKVASDKKSQSVAVAVVDGQWCLAGLLDCGKVYKKRREAIPVGASAVMYVSNYLYALTQKGFRMPPSFWAASRLCEGKPAGEPFDELAGLEPERLAYILRWSADPYGVVLDGDETLALRWRGVWAKGVDADKAQQALSDLGLTVFAPAAAPEPERIETTDLDRWCDVVGGMRGHRQMFQHLSAARFLDASNGSVRILVADERIKTAIETAMSVIAPSLSKMFGAKVLAVEVREV